MCMWVYQEAPSSGGGLTLSLTHSFRLPVAVRRPRPFRPAGLAMTDFTSYFTPNFNYWL